ncbi:MAG: hypothetical protein WC647_13695 [Desulfomonilaceae bacterium]|jgi:hypothetical protein
MNVVEKDPAVQGMLKDEYERCLDVLDVLLNKISGYPRGALNCRKKHYKDKQYVYYYLVLRDGNRIINRHVKAEELPDLQKKLAERNKCKKEIQTYRKRILYLEKLLNVPRIHGVTHEPSV